MNNDEANLSTEEQLRTSLCRLARFGANITDSHSCFVFLPPAFLSKDGEDGDSLLIGGHHSLSTEILTSCSIRNGNGLIGWVAKHSQPIHVSPFEHDSRTLGMYKDDRKLKSFIGIPIKLRKSVNEKISGTGVIACDSKKSFAFSKLQGKLLDNLAEEVSNTVALTLSNSAIMPRLGWDEFISESRNTIATLGPQSVDVMRLRIQNFTYLEQELGSSEAVSLSEQLVRLLKQSLPPHFPLFQIPNGDLLIILDNMMSSFYENRITALAEHIQPKKAAIKLAFKKAPIISRSRADISLEDTIVDTSFDVHDLHFTGEDNHEYRRA